MKPITRNLLFVFLTALGSAVVQWTQTDVAKLVVSAFATSLIGNTIHLFLTAPADEGKDKIIQQMQEVVQDKDTPL